MVDDDPAVSVQRRLLECEMQLCQIDTRQHRHWQYLLITILALICTLGYAVSIQRDVAAMQAARAPAPTPAPMRTSPFPHL